MLIYVYNIMGWKREERGEREKEEEKRQRIYITYQFIILKTLFNLIKKKKSFISWYISDIYFYVDYT